MKILGISCYYHDAAAVLLEDGRITAGAEEERFSRKKHDSGFPGNAIDFCLAETGLNASDLDYVVFYEKPFRKFHRILISTLSTFPRSYASFREAIRLWMTQKLWIKSEIASYLKLPGNKILFSEHHLSHAASAFYPSPFEKSAILTVDGVGEWTTASTGFGSGNKIKLLKEIHFPQSLGLLYSAFTAFLGFEVNEGEWKVMGLAPYGKPKYQKEIRKTVKMNGDGSFSLNFDYFSFHWSDRFSFSQKLVELLGKPVNPQEAHLITARSADIAASIQAVTEELLLNMAKNLKKITKSDNLCLAGGVALNSVANYRLLKESGFKNIFVQPAAGDSGGALGAALYLYHHVLNKPARTGMNHAYLGQAYSNREIEQFLHIAGGGLKRSGSHDSREVKVIKLSNNKLIDYCAEQIMKGKVIGWFRGRFEWGPRALGNRSILADPRNPKMKDIINSKVKFREAFRPFAPSVLSDQAGNVFDLRLLGGGIGQWPNDSSQVAKHFPLRFMLYVVPVKPDWRKKVPAITHADNTARPQLVYKNTNPDFHSLISAFYKKTGVPLLLNTSFNLKGEPIVASPADAYSTFKRSGIDILVMSNFVCEKAK
ncbi:MAG: hypothetical protein UV73_C0005G0041 [Candidatus Gottesmanbacteria bacterium GW2011_GWA2_43_14]|uniref:Carbamoyltransferase n=1 Tax=Candidatus Gottesmanbacteria bacterium GW2011_GWA2_43_14 TaxID=1618443 RepID=A0A0G1DJE5_9BACT|nr:MAG: hypothetical protein UV73_C0005G0041 [Candidatus Gottesmanbacteria bacterium GW2011_GWA2_43_14]